MVHCYSSDLLHFHQVQYFDMTNIFHIDFQGATARGVLVHIGHHS